MTSKHLWFLITVALLGGAVLMSVWRRHQADAAEAWAQAVALDQRLQDEAHQAYRSGRTAVAIPALDAYLQYLELSDPLVAPWQPGENPWLDGRGLAIERMMTAGRLATIMERLAAEDRAAALWARAVEHARASGRSDVSVTSVREAVQRSSPTADPLDPDVH